jgi:hypothetical protein
MTPTLESGVRYIVTKGSDDGTLDVGDHIWLERDLIHCREAQGWIAPEDTAEAMQGVEVMIDDQWYKSHISKLTKELERLASMEL